MAASMERLRTSPAAASASGRTTSAQLAAMLPQAGSRWDWLPRLPKWLDPLSTLIALKTCVGLVIGVSIALWLGWSATGVGFACIMLQTAYLGRTLGRSILRMAGALAGALLALAFIAIFIQERAALITAYALLTGLIIYAEQVSEHPYALVFVLLSVGMITFNTINDPQNAFSEAVSWVSGNALGVTIVLFMHGVLWPHTGERSFEQQLSTFMQGLSRLFALKMAALPQEARQHDPASREATLTEIHQLENRLMGALVPLRLALGIAARDTDRFIRFRAAYADLMEQLQSLTSVIMAYGDSLRVWRDTPLADAIIPHSPAPHVLMSTLQQQLDDLVAGCDRSRDGTDPPQRQDVPHIIATQIEVVRQTLGAHDHSVLEVALFDAVSEKALETSQAVAGVRQALATVEQPGRHVAPLPGAQVDVITKIQSRGLRLQKAAIGVVAVFAASLLWIYLQWPDPGSLMVMVLLPVALNAMVPTFPIKAALKSLFWGPVIGALLYFVIMPPLNDMWQLAPLVVLCLFPTAYLTNSPNSSTMIFGLMTSLWAFLLIDVSQGQVYSFAQFSNNALGIIGGTGVALAALAFFNPPVPERQFKTYARNFLQRCERTIGDLRQHTTQPSGRRDTIAGRRAEWLELLGLCDLWGRQLDPRRHLEGERAKLGAFMDSLRSLAFRLEALEEARQRHPDETLIAGPCERCRAAAISALGTLREALAGAEPGAATAELAATADDFRAALEPLHAAAHERGEIRDSLHQALTLTGYYHAVAQAVGECQERAVQIDWQKWDEAYF
jgi:uncharacterized membrane protein YccC